MFPSLSVTSKVVSSVSTVSSLPSSASVTSTTFEGLSAAGLPSYFEHAVNAVAVITAASNMDIVFLNFI